MDDETPSYTPNEVAAQRVARSVQHHGGPTTGMGAELPALIRHYYDQFMAGPRTMGQVAHGELDPTSPEGVRQGFGAATQTMGARSAFPMVPHSLGAGGGKIIQPPAGVWTAKNTAPPRAIGGDPPGGMPPAREINQYAPPAPAANDAYRQSPGPSSAAPSIAADTAHAQMGLQGILEAIWGKPKPYNLGEAGGDRT